MAASAALFVVRGKEIHHQSLGPRNFDMRVDLHGAEILVAQESLDDPQIDAVREQMRGEGMPEHMWRDQVRPAQAGCDRSIPDLPLR